MLVIGNVFGHGFGKDAIAGFEGAGFTFRGGESRYAGAQVCHFIDFEEGPSIELVEVADPRAYLDFVPDGMKPYAPGIGLIVPDWAERDLDDFARRHAAFRPYPLHVPYDGSDDTSRPGWSYLNFATPLVPGVFIWLTHLDEPVPRRPEVPPHPNGVLGVRGLVFQGNEDTLRHVARVAEAPMSRGALTIEGVTLWPRTALEDVPRIRGKAFPLLAVVVEMPDLKDLPSDLRTTHAATFDSRPAVHFPTNDLAWDLLFTESDPDHPVRRFPTVAAEAPQFRRRASAAERTR